MTPEEIREQLTTIIAEKFGTRISVQQIQWDTRLRDDLGIDSLAVAELMYEIEDTFGTTLEDTEPTTLVTVRDAVDAIARELQMPMAS
jgi:acyl carrier protein